MRKTLIATTATILLATGSAFADSSALDVLGAPERGASESFLPNFGLYGGGADAISGDNRFGDVTPAFAETDAAPAVDFTPTAAIEGDVAEEEIYSPDNGFGDYSPGYFGNVR
jgi:hypothetical protein